MAFEDVESKLSVSAAPKPRDTTSIHPQTRRPKDLVVVIMIKKLWE